MIQFRLRDYHDFKGTCTTPNTLDEAIISLGNINHYKDMDMHAENMEYAGFWIRVGASLIDTALLMIITWPVLTMIYGESYWASETVVQGFWDLLFSYVLPAVAVIVFWIYKSATPGKMALRLKIVDASTGNKPSNGQLIGRYLGYYVSAIPLALGLIWVGIDKRKQGWHDKLARTVVVRNMSKEPVNFGN